MGLVALKTSAHFAHGTRARYVSARCRCVACRRANAEYKARRKAALKIGESNRLVSAQHVREHLNYLRQRGLGWRAVADASDVPVSTVRAIRDGRRNQLREQTAKRLLRVDKLALADSALVASTGVQRDLARLKRLGLTQREVSERLGSRARTPVFHQRGARVFASTAMRVKALRVRAEREATESAAIGAICPDCGAPHTLERRLRWLKAHQGAEPAAIRAENLCWWRGQSGRQLLNRDLKRLRGLADGA